MGQGNREAAHRNSYVKRFGKTNVDEESLRTLEVKPGVEIISICTLSSEMQR